MQSISLMVNTIGAIERGATTIESQEQQQYQRFLMQLEESLEGNTEALFAFKIMLKKPTSRGAQILLQEELEELADSNPQVTNLAQDFLHWTRSGKTIHRKMANQGREQYNIMSPQGIVIGYANHNTISVSKN